MIAIRAWIAGLALANALNVQADENFLFTGIGTVTLEQAEETEAEKAFKNRLAEFGLEKKRKIVEVDFLGRFKVVEPMVVIKTDLDVDSINKDGATMLAKLTEKSLREFVKKAGQEQRKKMTESLTNTIVEITKGIKKKEEAGKKLKGAMPQALDAAVASWEEKCFTWLKPFLDQSDDAATMLESWLPEQISNNSRLTGFVSPQESEPWKKGLEALLTPEEVAARAAEEKKLRDKRLVDLKDYLDSSEQNATVQFDAMMDEQLEQILKFGGIDEEREKKLRAAAKTAVQETTGVWRKNAETALLAMDEDNLQQATANNANMGVDVTREENQPHMNRSWKESQVAIIGSVEQTRINEERAKVKTRRAAALAALLVAEIDRFVVFNEEQRIMLRTLGINRLQALPKHHFESSINRGYYNLDMKAMLKLLSEKKPVALDSVTVPELNYDNLLSSAQKSRWDTIDLTQLMGNRTRRISIKNREIPSVKNEIDMERTISRLLSDEARGRKKSTMAMMEARIDTIVSLVSLDSVGVATLQTAAKGFIHYGADPTDDNWSNWVRNHFQGIKPADFEGRMKSLFNSGYSDNSRQPESQLWNRAIEMVLNDSQRKIWQTECDAREAWRLAALSNLVVTEIEKSVILSEEQRTAVLPKLEVIIRDYEMDLNNYFSQGWYIQGYYSAVPMALLAEKERKAIFGKEVMKVINERCLTNANQYAASLRRQRAQRFNQ